MANKLTMKQKAFADHWIETGNGSDAAIKAGYSPKSARAIASQNLDRQVIKDYIAEKMKAKDEQQVANQDEILKFLTQVMRGEIEEQIPLLNGDGFQRLTHKDMSAKDRVKAAELLGKRHMLWTEKVDINGTLQVQIIDDIRDDE